MKWFGVATALGLVAASQVAVAADDPVVDATPEAVAMVTRAAELLHGPRALSTEPLELALDAIVGGKDGAAAAATALVVLLDPGGRNLRFGGPDEGDAERLARMAAKPARISVEFLVGGILPYPWDSWKGVKDDDGVLHVLYGTEGHWKFGTEVSFDERGLPVASWNLMPDKDGALHRASHATFSWEPAGSRFRLTEVSHSVAEHEVMHCRFEWGPVEDVMPRRWSIFGMDRMVRFQWSGHPPRLPPDLDPIMTYALDPQPRRFIERMKSMGDQLLGHGEGRSDPGDLQSVALAAILRAEPSLTVELTDELCKAGPGPARVLVRALARCTDKDLPAVLERLRDKLPESVRGEVDACKAGLPRPLETPIPMDDARAGASALDRCWTLYFVSGDPAALRPITGALRGLDTKERHAMIVGGAARWSLASIARQLESVRECLVRDLPALPEELRRHVSALLEKAKEPAKPAGGAGPAPGRK